MWTPPSLLIFFCFASLLLIGQFGSEKLHGSSVCRSMLGQERFWGGRSSVEFPGAVGGRWALRCGGLQREAETKRQEIGETDGDAADRECKERQEKKAEKIVPIIPSSSF